MSSGIGFAGLGKHLAERTLGLVRRKGTMPLDPRVPDNRMSDSNQTAYDELIKWQQLKRQRSESLRHAILVSLTSISFLLILLLLFYSN